jgi:hypothetical protein
MNSVGKKVDTEFAIGFMPAFRKAIRTRGAIPLWKAVVSVTVPFGYNATRWWSWFESLWCVFANRHKLLQWVIELLVMPLCDGLPCVCVCVCLCVCVCVCVCVRVLSMSHIRGLLGTWHRSEECPGDVRHPQQHQHKG